MSKAKIIRLIVFIITFLGATCQAIAGHQEAELLLLFLSLLNYKLLEDEE